MQELLLLEKNIDGYTKNLEQAVLAKPSVKFAEQIPQEDNTGHMQKIDNQETISLTRMDSNSVPLMAVGAALTATAAGFVARFMPDAGPQAVAAGVGIGGWALGKYLLKSGPGNAITKGLVLGAIVSLIYPTVSRLGVGISGNGGGSSGADSAIPTGA